jgi:putative DNA primase/helicase
MCGRLVAKGCEPIDYEPYNAADPIQAEIDEFMSKVFPDSSVRDYMWRKLASCLEGANREQRYDTWIGVGGNGKSKLVDLVAMTLGDYGTSLQSTVLTRKRPDSGAANPDIITVWKKRFIYLAEPDDGEPLNTSRMKQFTGEDIVEARGLFEDQQKFKITGKFFMLCNRFPPIYSNDRGTWRRVTAVPFVSKFVDENSEEGKDIDPEKHIYPRDNNLDEKLMRWRTAFLARLVHIYENVYLKQGIEPIPDIITAESRSYRAKFDTFGKFIADRIRQNPTESTTLQEAYRQFKSWHKENARGTTLIQMDEFNKRMEDEFGQPSDRKTFKRIQVFSSDAETEEFDMERKEQ